MTRTLRFREQHNDLLQLAGTLQEQLQIDALTKDATAARNALSRLMGKLTMHLSTEDEVLYPELQSHPDPKVAELARKFMTEMRGTTQAIAAYNDKWKSPSVIKANPAGFVAETKHILQALGDRIKRENQQLYAAADRIAGKTL